MAEAIIPEVEDPNAQYGLTTLPNNGGRFVALVSVTAWGDVLDVEEGKAPKLAEKKYRKV